MQTRRWVNPSQPETLQLAVWLGYFWAVAILLWGFDYEYLAFPGVSGTSGAVWRFIRIAIPVGIALGAWLIANERRSGWTLSVALAALPLVLRLMLGFGLSLGVSAGGHHINPISTQTIGLMFDIARFALLVHPRSRSYQRIWFQ